MPLPDEPSAVRQPPVATDLLALDIGGANLKAADGCGWSVHQAFPLWRRWRDLADVLTGILRSRRPNRVVATMTGEICDCYPSRAGGVTHIVESLAAAAEAAGCGPPGIYLTDGRIVSPAEAMAGWRLAAASNWHALGRLAATLAPDASGLLIDIGSTTTDIVPFDHGRVAATATDDAARMLVGELVYTGLERSAVASIVRWLPHRGRRRPVASELFAESRDAWLSLGGLTDDPACHETADGGPATADAARIRLARTMLLDPESFTAADAMAAADCIAARQATLVARALLGVARRTGGEPDAVVLAGHGGPLAARALAATGWNVAVCSLAERIGPGAARAAPAHALACIARGTVP
jgi:probable H4MPT-linked C1 transfer pathway protein